MMKYLVTGSTGFIGSRLLGLLKTKDCEVRLLAKSEVNNYETVVCNLGQDRIPKRTLESIDTVFHLAGLAHDVHDPRQVEDLYRAINVQATVELARLAVKNGVRQFVFISSVKAGDLPLFSQYGSVDLGGESDGIYGKTKKEAELQLLKIGNETGMHVSIIRPSLVYGPNVKGNLQLMLTGIKKGWFPPLPETNNKRSMIHVDDLVRAIFLIAKDERANGEIFIATDKTEHSSRDIYDAMCNAVGKSTPKWSVPKILFDIASLLSPRIKYKIKKLFSNEFYSSVKLEELGFQAQKTLRDMNETDF